jgi:hypothetical protein
MAMLEAQNHITTNCTPPARAPTSTGDAVDDQLDLLRLAADNAVRNNDRTGSGKPLAALNVAPHPAFFRPAILVDYQTHAAHWTEDQTR